MEWKLEGGGRLSLREEGPRVRLEAARRDDGSGLYKVWVRGPGGEMLLGTLAPEGGELRLCRTGSRTGLERAGCWPVAGGRAALTYRFPKPGEGERSWRPADDPGRLCRDPLVAESLRGRPGFCQRRAGEYTLLSAPCRPEEPFPLPILFCLARVERRGGRPWLVWAFDREGNPVVPSAGEEPSEDWAGG